ncbi:phage tail protein, partial [Enterobacter hormaechei]
SDDDKALFNEWLDYLDALKAVDTSSAADITWPEIPAT